MEQDSLAELTSIYYYSSPAYKKSSVDHKKHPYLVRTSQSNSTSSPISQVASNPSNLEPILNKKLFSDGSGMSTPHVTEAIWKEKNEKKTLQQESSQPINELVHSLKALKRKENSKTKKLKKLLEKSFCTSPNRFSLLKQEELDKEEFKLIPLQLRTEEARKAWNIARKIEANISHILSHPLLSEDVLYQFLTKSKEASHPISVADPYERLKLAFQRLPYAHSQFVKKIVFNDQPLSYTKTSKQSWFLDFPKWVHYVQQDMESFLKLDFPTQFHQFMKQKVELHQFNFFHSLLQSWNEEYGLVHSSKTQWDAMSSFAVEDKKAIQALRKEIAQLVQTYLMQEKINLLFQELKYFYIIVEREKNQLQEEVTFWTEMVAQQKQLQQTLRYEKDCIVEALKTAHLK